MTIRNCVEEILAEYQRNGSELSDEDRQSLARLVTEVIPQLPRTLGPLFVPVMSRNVPASVELIIIRDRKVLLVKREWFGEDAYHFPGGYIAPGETFLAAAQRIAELELKVRVTSAEQFGPPTNSPTNPRFHDLTVLVRCEIEGEPQAGEWFSERPSILKVQSGYWPHIEPLLKREKT